MKKGIWVENNLGILMKITNQPLFYFIFLHHALLVIRKCFGLFVTLLKCN